MNAAAPDGAPPRRINYRKNYLKNLLAPPCLGEALRRGTLIIRIKNSQNKSSYFFMKTISIKN
jgi:hypothetical protein